LDTEETRCDHCGAAASRVLYRLTDTAHFVPGEFILRQCERCRLIYLSPRPTRASLGAYYPASYPPYRPPIESETWSLLRWMRRRKLQRRRQLVAGYLGQPTGSILDVGCATGLFLHEMAQAGWQAAGVELVDSAAAFARQTFGLDVFTGELSEAPFPAASFDAVTFWDVLEHTFSPRQALADAARLLRPGGVLGLSLPNWDSFDRRLFGRHWQGLDCPRHMFVFPRPVLAQMLQEAGFTDLKWLCFMPGYFTFLPSLQRWLNTLNPALSHAVLRVLSLHGMRLIFEPWFALMNGLQRGPILSVFARRAGP
jgi:SAM-dependent methyltransferase